MEGTDSKPMDVDSSSNENTSSVNQEVKEATSPSSSTDATTTSPDVPKPLPAKVIGIDFGNQNVVVALASQEQEFLPKIVQNNLDNHHTPNMISFKDDERSIGEEALNQFVSFPKGTISSVKRLIGKSVDEIKDEFSRLPYSSNIKEENGKFIIEVLYENEKVKFTPEQIAGMLFSKIKWFTEKKEKSATTDCVIAIPGSFSPNQRSSIIDAANIAGLNVLGLVHENTAAALNYGVNRNQAEGVVKHVLLLDQGQSYFSAQVIAFTKDKLTVLSSMNDDTFGSRVFDFTIFDLAQEEFKKKTNLDLSTNVKSVARLLNTSEKTKQILSTIPATELTVECIMNDKDLSMHVTRSTVENICLKHLEKLGDIVKKVVENSGIAAETLDVEIIGGGLRSPLCQDKIKKALNCKDLRFSLDGSHCIAIGAALMGKILNPAFQFNYVVEDSFNVAATAKLTPEELQKAIEVNQKLIQNDKLVSSKKDMKNSIEAYIYATRNQLSDIKMGEFFNSEEKTNVNKVLDDAENWIYEDGEQANLEVMTDKLNEIKKSVGDAAPKYREHLIQKEEQRIKEQKEAEEYARLNPVNESTHKDRREPRTKKEKLEMAGKRKTQGNTLFKEGDFENATTRYIQAIGYFDDIFDLSDAEKKEVSDLKLQSYSNLAACWLKLKQYEKAQHNCTMVLQIDDKNVKALFRRGQAQYYLKDFEASLKDLNSANKLDPTNNDVKKILKTVQDKVKEQTEKEKKIYQKMFG